MCLKIEPVLVLMEKMCLGNMQKEWLIIVDGAPKIMRK